MYPISPKTSKIRGIIDIVKASLNFLLNINKLASNKIRRISMSLIII